MIGSSFHIVAFSLLFHKKFICVGANNTKVMELLLQYNLESRLRDEIDNVFLEENYVREINYDIIDNKMEIMREQSIQYLKDSLRTVSNRL